MARNKDVEALIAGLTALDDATKPMRTGVEAVSASIEDMLKDIEVSSTSTDVVLRDMAKKGMEILSAGMATITDDVEVLYTAEKIISAKKTVIADIEILSKNIDVLYKVMEAAFEVLAVEFTDLEAQFRAKKAALITNQDIMERVFLHLYCTCNDLECIRIGCGAIHNGLSNTYMGCEKVSQSINWVYEDLQTASELQEDLFAALKDTEHVRSDGKSSSVSNILEVFCLCLELLSKDMDAVTISVRLMHVSIESIHFGINTVRKFVQKAVGNMKGAYEGMKFILP